MKAAILKKYGGPENIVIDDLVVEDLKPNQICVQVICSTIASGDRRIRSIDVPFGYRLIVRAMFGWKRPRKGILGTELSGKVVSVGSEVSRFRVGDKVIVNTGTKFGAHAQFVTVKESDLIIPKPELLSDQQAAALCFGGVTALDYLERRANLRAKESLLVLGANGAVGSAAVQIAKTLGANVVAAVKEPDRFETQLTKLGATRVETTSVALRQKYDVILDCTGVFRSADLIRCLRAEGRLLLIVTSNFFSGLCLPLLPLGKGRRIVTGVAEERIDFMERLAALAKQGRFVPAVAQTFDFENIVAAHAFADKGGVLGSVVLSMNSLHKRTSEVIKCP